MNIANLLNTPQTYCGGHKLEGMMDDSCIVSGSEIIHLLKERPFRIQDAPDPCPLDPFGCPKHFGILMMPIDLSPETFPVPSSQDDWRMGRNTYVFVSKLMRVGSERPLSHLGKTFHRRYIRVCLVQFSVRLISRSIIKQRACLVLSRRASLKC